MPLIKNKEEKKRLLRELPLMFSRLIIAGIPVNRFLKKKALVIGAGGLGVIVAETLARTGIGGLYIVDRDVVREENFNRLGFSREDIGKPKAVALAEKIKALRNADTIDKKYHINVMAFHADIIGWSKLESLIKDVDIVFTCVDNAIARSEVNYFIMKHKKPMIDGATSYSGFNGTVMTIIPCKTPCYECYYGSRSLIKVNNIERIGYCDASLATTMSIIASLQVDQGLKILLGYGKIYPMIKVYLDSGVEIVTQENLKPRKDCVVHRRFCNG
ncbi:MAG: HesA/MoeB/ThiF family protein [Candidatus Njordarchaeales archaeon]